MFSPPYLEGAGGVLVSYPWNPTIRIRPYKTTYPTFLTEAKDKTSMEFNTIEVPIDGAGPEAQQNISIYSDVHIGSTHCALDRLKRHMDARAKLPNARFIMLGDMWDFVLRGDTRRFLPSEQVHSPVDAALDADFMDAYQFLKRYPIDIMHLGNHEFEVLKRHYTNPIQIMCDKLDVLYGGYSSFLRYVFRTDSKDKQRGLEGGRTATFLLHHGAWGGKVVKGFGGARDYARAYDDWDVFAYGHNHQYNVHKEVSIGLTAKGRPRIRDRYFVNTGTWLQTATEGSLGYGERRGYGPTALGSPLVKLTPTRTNGVNIKVSIDDNY